MSKVDDELSRRFHRAERSVGSEDLFEGLARRRRRRRTLQRLQAGALAVAVLGATAGGFVVLRSAFDEARTGDTGEPPILPRNGEIVFSAGAADGFVHLYAMQPDGSGRRRITDFGTDDTAPAVSPDGRTIAFVHQLADVAPAIATVPIGGGVVTWLTDPEFFVTDGPTWSPDGTEIAFAGTHGEGQRIYVMNADGSDARPITGRNVHWPDGPSWSPDGSTIAFAASPISGEEEPSVWDIYTVAPDGTDLTNRTQTSDVSHDEGSPTWSPDSQRLAFTRTGPQGSSIVIRRLSDGVETQATEGIYVEGSPAWSPDGRWISFDRAGVERDPGGHPAQQDVWLVRPDGTGETRLTTDGAFTPTWQPIPAGSSASVEPAPEPSASPSREPEGRDVGLGSKLCDIEELDGIDWYGDGTAGAAWTGARVTDAGRCPRPGEGQYLVAADLDGDGVAEPGGVGFLAHCLLCRPYAATDLNDDGVQELVVLEEASSTPSYTILEVSMPTSERSPGIYNLFVSPPGAREANVPANEPLRIDAGGDEGYSSEIVCEPPVITWTWTLAPIDSQEPTEVHYIEIELRDDGAFHVVGRNDFLVPSGQPTDATDHTAPSCGVDWHPAP